MLGHFIEDQFQQGLIPPNRYALDHIAILGRLGLDRESPRRILDPDAGLLDVGIEQLDEERIGDPDAIFAECGSRRRRGRLCPKRGNWHGDVRPDEMLSDVDSPCLAVRREWLTLLILGICSLKGKACASTFLCYSKTSWRGSVHQSGPVISNRSKHRNCPERPSLLSMSQQLQITGSGIRISYSAKNIDRLWNRTRKRQ